MQQVVAAAIVVDGCVLAARRSAPPELAGGWEFPGGKVESGETPGAALIRESREELGVDVEPLHLLATAEAAIELSLWLVHLAAGTPVALQDHDELRWVGLAELDALDWLPIDRELLDPLRSFLS